MTPADVCVIIPTLNEQEGIAKAIRSVASAGQVIVVDAGSGDETVARAQQFENVLVLCSQAGRGHQLQLGAMHGDRPILLFLHADCRVSSDALQTVAQSIADGKRWGAMRQMIMARGLKYRLLEKGNAARVQLLGKPFGDQAMFVERSLYHEVGGFRAIPLMEDVDLALRLRAKCWPVLLACYVRASARRWQRRGVVKQTLRNWFIQFLYACGVSPNRLARIYR